MAKFEKGKGRKKAYWDTTVHGSVLSAREWGDGDDRLRGYRVLADAAVARAEQIRLAKERVEQGYAPVDDAARSLAAALAPAESASAPPPSFPVRADIYVYNEGTGFLVTSGRMEGKRLENGGKKWEKAVQAGDLLPVALNQDDSFLIRVVAGDALTPQEEAEWVGRIEGHLHVPDGKLVVSAVAEFVESGNEEGDVDDYVRFLDIPKGHYDATLYSYLPGVNGAPCLDHLAGGHKKDERVGAWMRRTRPGVAFPDWLRLLCIGDPKEDPGHQKEWEGLPYPDDDELDEYVHFLLHLRPSEPPARAAKAEGLEGGWFVETTGARRPELCPLGLVATNVTGHQKKESAEWTYVQEVASLAEPFPLAALPSPVTLDVTRVGQLYGLASLAHAQSLPAVKATLPEGGAFDERAAWSDSFVVFRDGDTVHALPNSDAPGILCRAGLAALGARFKALPDGTRLEIACAVIDGQTPKSGDAGLQRYRGPVSGGEWRIEEAFPAVTPDRLRAALALVHELQSSDHLAVQDEAEAGRILDRLKKVYGPYAFEDNPAGFKDGSIRLKKPEPGLLWLVGSAAFGVRFGDAWPVREALTDDEEW